MLSCKTLTNRPLVSFMSMTAWIVADKASGHGTNEALGNVCASHSATSGENSISGPSVNRYSSGAANASL